MIKFECIACKQIIEAPEELMGQIVECPTCKETFWPDKFLPTEAAKLPETTKQGVNPVPDSTKQSTLAEWEKLRKTADMLTGFAFLLCGIGVVALLLGIGSVASNDDSSTCWLVMGVCFGGSFWFYYVAQIIHIRALLSKK